MTAEIAIINRSSVTLAADSAMTMSVAGQRKIYTSTDKIFELSEKDPVGIMIYNNLEFMGAPLDVVIKQFRASRSCRDFASLKDAPTTFFDYLITDWMASDSLQKRHAKDLLTPVYEQIWEIVWSEIGAPFSKKEKSKKKPLEILLDYMRESIATYESVAVANCFMDVTEDYLIEFYK